MKLALLTLISLLIVSCSPQQELNTSLEIQPASEVITMKLTSSVFQHNGRIPSKHTCDENDVSPALHFSDVPKNAKSLALD